MLWDCITFYGAGILVFLDGRKDSKKYVETLKSELLPVAAELFGEQNTWVFQQDNEPIHTSHLTRSWLLDNAAKTLPWPARSPYLNIIENVWGYLAGKVYARNRSFENICQLKLPIKEAWASIATDYIFSLYRSIPRRPLAVIDRKGDATTY